MKVKRLSALVGIPLLAAGVVAGAGAANAASLTGAGEVSFVSSVVLRGVLDTTDIDGDLDFTERIGTEFDFVDPLDGGNGEADISALSGSGGFVSFNSVTSGTPDGLVTDSIIFGDATTSPALPFDLVQLFNDNTGAGTPGDDTFFTVTEVDFAPTFTQDGEDLNGSIGVKGFWTSPDGTFDGSIFFTTQFVDKTLAELDAELDTGVDILPANGISATGNAFVSVPEPTSAAGALFAMGLGAFSLKRKKQQAK